MFYCHENQTDNGFVSKPATPPRHRVLQLCQFSGEVCQHQAEGPRTDNTDLKGNLLLVLSLSPQPADQYHSLSWSQHLYIVPKSFPSQQIGNQSCHLLTLVRYPSKIQQTYIGTKRNTLYSNIQECVSPS